MSQQNIVHEKLPDGSTKLTNEKTGASLVLSALDFAFATNRAAAAAKLRQPSEEQAAAAAEKQKLYEGMGEKHAAHIEAIKVAQAAAKPQVVAAEPEDKEPLRPARPLDPLAPYGPARKAAEDRWQEWRVREDKRNAESAAQQARRQKLDDDIRLAKAVGLEVVSRLPQQPATKAEAEPSYKPTDFDGMNRAFSAYQAAKRSGAPATEIAAHHAEFQKAAGLPEPQPTEQANA